MDIDTFAIQRFSIFLLWRLSSFLKLEINRQQKFGGRSAKLILVSAIVYGVHESFMESKFSTMRQVQVNSILVSTGM